MTVSDSRIQLMQQHLNALFDDPTLEPSDELLRDFEDTLRTVHIDPSILVQTLPIILKTIQSHETTRSTKLFSIKVLSVLLPYFTISQIKTIIDDDLMYRAFSGPQALQKVIADLIARAGKGEVDTNLVHNLFESLKLVNDVGVVNSIEKAIVQLVKVNDINEELFQIDISDFYDDTLLYSRLISVSTQLLPFVPNLPDSWYMVSEEQLLKYDDVLFFQYVLGSIQTLISYMGEIDINQNIEKQVDWIASMFTEKNSKFEEMEGFCEFQIVDVLTTLASSSEEMFNKFDKKYKIVEYASLLQNEKSFYFMATIKPRYLKNIDFRVPLGHKTIDIFCNLISDDDIASKVDFDEVAIKGLTFEEIYKIFLTLCKSKTKMKIMVQRCPILIEKMVNSHITNNEMFEIDQIEQLLFELSRSGIDLGELRTSIDKKLNGEVSVMGPLTQTR